MSLAAYTSKTWTDYADSPCLEAVELNRIDSGIAAVTAELLALEAALPTTYQPISAELSALAALSSTGYAKRTGAAAWSVVPSIPQSDVAGLTTALAGLQPLDSDLTAIAALTTTSFGRSLLTVADAATARTAIGAQAAGSYEAAIAAGTTAQYWRGDKTWQTLNAAAVGLGSVLNVAQEPALGNPTSTGYLLSSTAAGVRSWVAPYTHPATHPQSVVDSASGWITTALAGKQAAGSYQPLDADLTAISALATTGFVRRTAADTWSASAMAWADISGIISYGTTAGTVCQGNDSRLSDARTPTAHTHGWTSGLTGVPAGLAEVTQPQAHGNIKLGATNVGSWHGIEWSDPDRRRLLISGGASSDFGFYDNGGWRLKWTSAGALVTGTVPWGNLTSVPSAFTPAAHTLDSALHTISGKTAGQVLLATEATTFAFTTMSGDATLSGTGALTLASVVTAGVSGIDGWANRITWDAKGRITAVSAYQITPAGIGALPLAGGTMTGAILSTAPWSAAAGQLKIGTTGAAGRMTFNRGSDGSDAAYIGYAAASSVGDFVIQSTGGQGTLRLGVNAGDALLIGTDRSVTLYASLTGVGAAFSGSLTRGGYTVWDSGNLTGDQTAHSHSYDRDRANHTGTQAQSTIVANIGWISDALNGRVLTNAWNNQTVALAGSGGAYFSDTSTGDICVRAAASVPAVRLGVYPGSGNPASMVWYSQTQVGFGARPTWLGYVPWDSNNLVGTRNEHNHAGLYQVKENQSLSSTNSVQFVGLTLNGDLTVSTYQWVAGSDTVPANIPTLGYSYNRVTPNTINDSATYCVVKLPAPVYGKSVFVYSLPGKSVVIRSASGASIVYNSSGALTVSESLSGMSGSGRPNGGCGFWSDGTYWYCMFNSTNA